MLGRATTARNSLLLVLLPPIVPVRRERPIIRIIAVGSMPRA